jgi:hypothetical protein
VVKDDSMARLRDHTTQPNTEATELDRVFVFEEAASGECFSGAGTPNSSSLWPPSGSANSVLSPYLFAPREEVGSWREGGDSRAKPEGNLTNKAGMCNKIRGLSGRIFPNLNALGLGAGDWGSTIDD